MGGVCVWRTSMGVTLQQGIQRAAHGSDSSDVISLLAGGGGGGGGGDGGGGGNSGPQGNHPEISTRDLPVSSVCLLHSAVQRCLWQNMSCTMPDRIPGGNPLRSVSVKITLTATHLCSFLCASLLITTIR